VVTVVLGALLAAVALFSLAAVVGLDQGERQEHRVHDLASAVQLGLLGAAMLIQAHVPERKIALTQLAVLTLTALGTGYALSGQPIALIGLILVALIVGLHPARDLLLSRGRFSVLLGILVVAAAVPLTPYALDQAAIQRAGGFGIHWSEYHWASMAALALGLPLAGIAAAGGAPGRRLAAWLVGGASALFGAGSLAFPDQVSSFGSTGGAVAVVGGLLFIAVAEWESGRAA